MKKTLLMLALATAGYRAYAQTSATSPILYNSGTGVISSQPANATQDGHLLSTDWVLFNGKHPLENQRLGTSYSPTFTNQTLTGDLTLTKAYPNLNLGGGGDGNLNLSAGNALNIYNGQNAKFRLLPYGNNIYFQNTQTSGGIVFGGTGSNYLTGDISFNVRGRAYFAGNAAYTSGRNISALDFLYKQKADSLYVNKTNLSGTNNYLPMFLSGNLENSVFYQSSFNVGVGTTTPGAKLHILTNGLSIPLRVSTDAPDIGQFISSNGYGGFRVATTGSGGPGAGTPFIALATGANITGSSVGTQRAYFSYNQNTTNFASLGYGSGTDALGYVTSGTNAGNVGIGLVAPIHKLDVNGTFRATTSITTPLINNKFLGNPINDVTSLGIGVNVLGSINNTDKFSTAVGYDILNLTTSGYENVGIGNSILNQNTIGIRNIGIGHTILSSNTLGSGNVAIGAEVLVANTTGGNNTAIGERVLQNNTTGYANVAMGSTALYSNTTGNYNVALGPGVLAFNTIGFNNIGIGHNTLNYNTQGSDNTAIGEFSLFNNTTGAVNVSIGRDALRSNSGGSRNIAIGANTMYGNTNGWTNVAIGDFALASNTLGSNSVAIGPGAGGAATTGSLNTFLGNNAGSNVTTGSNNTIIGANTIGLAANLSNYVIIGDGSGNRRLVVDETGKTGIGTTTPLAKLDVTGTTMIGGNTDANIAGINIGYIENTGKTLIGWNRSGSEGETDFVGNQGLGTSGGFSFYNHNNAGVEQQLVRIKGDGAVGIGMEYPDAKLAVNGDIHTKEVRVDMTGWSDYVFEPTYNLPSLESVKAYVDKNHHLPEMPSTAEVLKNGIKVGEMLNLQTKKIEELTLYVLELKRENEKLKNDNQERLKNLETIVEKLNKTNK